MTINQLVSLGITAGPAIEPLTLDQAKAHLILSESLDAADDAEIEALITAARTQVENDTGRQLITATFELRMPAFPCGREPIILSRPPALSVNEIRYTDQAGDTITLVKNDDFTYTSPDFQGGPMYIFPLPGAYWPIAAYQTPDAVIVDYDAGYGDAASDVPAPLIHAMKLALTHLYEHRGDADPPEFRSSAYEALIGKYRIMEYR